MKIPIHYIHIKQKKRFEQKKHYKQKKRFEQKKHF